MHAIMYTIKASEFCLVGVFFRRESPVIVLFSLKYPTQDFKLS